MQVWEEERAEAHLTFHSLTGSTDLTRGGRSSYSLPFWMARLIHSSVAMAGSCGGLPVCALRCPVCWARTAY